MTRRKVNVCSARCSSCKHMKKTLLLLLVSAAFLLAGCIVTSVAPFYTEKDLVFEPALIGNWLNQKNAEEIWKFEKSSDLSYRFTLIEAQKATVMEAHAFKLQGQLFVDLYSANPDYRVIPPHYLLKVTRTDAGIEDVTIES